MSAAESEDHSITLSGSAALVTEFFAYSVNTLLYQRGIYPAESFARVSKYGLTMLVSTDKRVEAYLKAVLEQMSIWLGRAELDRVAVVISSVATKEVLERWVFNVKTEPASAPDTSAPAAKGKVQSKIIAEIQALVRQITSSVTLLPLLDEPCSFDMLIYTNKNAETPALWDESGPRTIPNAESVGLRSFSTSVHNVEASVAYMVRDD
jgi:mitotic spindle assembly checkpoint protein MAD2